MLKKIKLYGELADRYGKYWELDVSSPAEAIRALCVNNEGMREFIGSSEERGVGYKIVVGNELLEPSTDLHIPTGGSDISLVPVVVGGKSKLGKIVVGAIMIYLAYSYGVDASGALTTTGNIAMNIGMSLVMSGIAELLAPNPKDSEATRSSYSFSGPTNTVEQGVAVPIAYGQVLVGGVSIGTGLLAYNT
jgi:predicted phage tail protein